MAVFQERHTSGEVHYHVALLAERCFRFAACKRHLLVAHGLASHWSGKTDGYAGCIAYCYLPSPTKAVEELDPMPELWPSTHPPLSEASRGSVSAKNLEAHREDQRRKRAAKGKAEQRVREVDLWPIIIKENILPDEVCAEKLMAYAKRSGGRAFVEFCWPLSSCVPAFAFLCLQQLHLPRTWRPRHHDSVDFMADGAPKHVGGLNQATITTVVMSTDIGGMDDGSSDDVSVGWSVVEMTFMQPSAKAAPLICPIQDDRPRFAAPFQVSSIGMTSPATRRGPSAQIPRVSDLQFSQQLIIPVHYPVQSAPSHAHAPLPVPNRMIQPPMSLQKVDRATMGSYLPPVQQMPLLGESELPASTRRLKGPQQQPSNQVIRARYPSASPALRNLWYQLLERLGPLSLLWSETLGSVHQNAHLNRIIDGYAPSTILKYVFTCTSFLNTCASLQLDISRMSDIGLADVLHTMSLARSSSGSGGSSIATIKALRWLHKVADVPSLNAVNSSLVSSFLTRKIPKDRKQAPPLPLWILVQWERRILMSRCPTMEVLLLGSFLIMAWASLRFSDVQRLDMKKVIYHDHTLRGLVWRSKASFGGIPFALAGEGFLSIGSHNWVWKFLTVLDQLYMEHAGDSMDF